MHSPSGKGSLLQHRYMVWTLTFREVVVVTAQVHGVDTHLQGRGRCYSTSTWCGHAFGEVVVVTAQVHSVGTHLQGRGRCYSTGTRCGHTFMEVVQHRYMVCGHSPLGKGSLLQHMYMVWTLTFRKVVVATA